MPSLADILTRDFQRYTGDGLPNEPVGHPPPVGDPSSGVFQMRKKDLRDLVRIAEEAANDATTAAPFLGRWSIPTETSYSGVSVESDALDQPALGGSKVNGFKVLAKYGGATARGGRHAIYGVLLQSAATASNNPDRNYVGVQGHVQSSTGDGGTAATLVGGRGAYFGASAIAIAEPGATNLLNLTGFEANSRAKAGSSVAYISGLQIVTKDEVQGAIFDAALAISRGQAAISVGKKHGILFGNMNGAPPVADDGTIIGWTGGGTVLHGLDFSAVTITGDLIRGGGARLNKGAVVLGTTQGAELDASTATSLTYKAAAHAFNSTVRPTVDNATPLGSSGQRWQAGYIVNLRPGSGAAIWTSGAGTPEGVIVASPGSLFTRTDGGAGSTLYVKESGGGSTGWRAV